MKPYSTPDDPDVALNVTGSIARIDAHHGAVVAHILDASGIGRDPDNHLVSLSGVDLAAAWNSAADNLPWIHAMDQLHARLAQWQKAGGMVRVVATPGKPVSLFGPDGELITVPSPGVEFGPAS
jgi:hypothetical protein